MSITLNWQPDGMGPRADTWTGLRFASEFNNNHVWYSFFIGKWNGPQKGGYIVGEYYFMVRDMNHNKRTISIAPINRIPCSNPDNAKSDALIWLNQHLAGLKIEQGTRRKMSSAINRR